MPDFKLSKLQKETLIFFGKNKFARNFYWTGGTALAYCYLDNRYSVDLDFFSENLFTDNEYMIFINELKKTVKADKIILTIKQNRRIYLMKRKNETVKLELVYFPFPSIKKSAKHKELSLHVDSLVDIMVNKILSAYQRYEVKDAYDLYCYLNNNPKYNIFKLINLVEKKFGVSIEPVLLFAKLNELSGGLDSLRPLLLKEQNNLSKKIKFFFQNIFNTVAKKRIK